MEVFKFEKELDGSWFVVLPEWFGDKSDLQMVSGADVMLDILSQGENVVELQVYLEDPKTSSEVVIKLDFVRKATELNNGAYYFINQIDGVVMNFTIWLCDVMLFIFKEFPNTIWVSKARRI